MPNKSIKIGTQFARAQVVPSSYKKDSGTFDIVIATETPVLRNGWEEAYNEILICSPSNVRMERANGGLPLLNAHPDWSGRVLPESVMGKIENIRFENKEIIGTVTPGAQMSPEVRADIENGILSTFSVGYKIFKAVRVDNGTNAIPDYQITDWEMNHSAIAPIPADFNSTKRSSSEENTNVFQIDNYKPKFQKMTIEQIRATATTEQLARLDAIVTIGRAANLGDMSIVGLFNSESTIDAIRSENPAKTPPIPPVPVPLDADAIRAAATTDMKTRFDAIMLSCRAANLEDAFGIELFRSDKTIEVCRHEIVVEFAKADPKTKGEHGAGVTVGLEAIDKKRELAENAILNRIDSKVFKLEDGARDFRGMSVHEIALSLYGERSGKVQIIGKDKMADMIFGKRDMSTSDFPLLLENVLNKGLRAEYDLAPEYWDQIARETSVSDFKPKALYQIGSANGMKEMAEGEEIKFGSMTEAKQTISIKEYAEGLLFTRRMFVNDDLSAFSNIPTKFVRDWNLLRGNLVWGLLTGSTVMDDNKQLFHADHGNLAGTNAAITDTSLAAAMIAFKAQKDIAGNKIRVAPKFLIVSSDKEFEARRVLYAGLTPATAANINLFAGSLTLIVEPRLAGNTWYLAADPSMIDGLYYCYMNGNSGLRSNRDDDFSTDSVKFGVRGEFGVRAIDYRGWYKNVGA
jgi:hypothetical protein